MQPIHLLHETRARLNFYASFKLFFPHWKGKTGKITLGFGQQRSSEIAYTEEPAGIKQTQSFKGIS